MTFQTTSVFRPSFPNPTVWTDELIAKRQQEFAVFQKSPEGIAEGKAFEDAYSEYETRRVTGAISLQAPRG